MCEPLLDNEGTLRFNLNLLECKSLKSLVEKQGLNVLISTYWNVNPDLVEAAVNECKVLISTYWNVNQSRLK